ncbi:MAG: hypothetical protein J0H39_10805 [Alphaproteobacteria bacterium]|nr:hypothetical protein [Alphaproteobacteria bacterium]
MIDPEVDRSIELAVYDILLPCRMYAVDHKVAVLGRASLTTEFLLRLVKAIPGISEEDAAAFFGFNLREASFVFAEAEGPGYIERSNGRLWLAKAGAALFRDGSPEPEIFAVEQQHREVGFDLISLAPLHPRFLTEFERGLPELAIQDEEAAGSAAARIPQAFRRFFFEISDRRERTKAEKKDLYSVDQVTAKNRFLGTVRTVVRARASNPSAEESDLILWRPEHEQADRPEIVSAVASFVDGLQQSRSEDNAEAYDTLISLAPEFLSDFARRDGLAVERYYREAITRAGDVRANRKTVPIVGSLLLLENRKRLFEVINHGFRQTPNVPELLLWLAPQVPSWNATTLLNETVAGIGKRLTEPQSDGLSERFKSICLTAPRPPRYLEKAFDTVCTSDYRRFPAPLEILMVPSVAVAILVHAPIRSPRGYAVPLGFVSFDETVLQRSEKYMLDNLGTYFADEDIHSKVKSAFTKS